MPPRIRQLPSTAVLLTGGAPQSLCLNAHRQFSTTTPLPITKLRRDFFAWLEGPGAVFKSPVYNDTNYLTSYDLRTGERRVRDDGKISNTPFPLNPRFKSEPVLSEELSEEVYRRVAEQKKSVRTVSAELSISLERVAAVVRLKTIEKKWKEENKPLAIHLTKALHSMLPTTPFAENQRHESIQDLRLHPLSDRQAFVSVPESRNFTREDAGKELGLPAADNAIPHPDLVTLERERLSRMDRGEMIAAQRERERLEEAKKQEAREREKEREKGTKVLEVGRWRWKLAEAKTGQVGFRYGVPYDDRKKGTVKIPTRVE
ncbi:3'-phosphoadenosine 5'-phosphosulfate sulfotransferase [Rhizina undulata]